MTKTWNRLTKFLESTPTDVDGKFLRQSVIVYQEDLGEFLNEFQKTLDYVKLHGTKKDRGRRN